MDRLSGVHTALSLPRYLAPVQLMTSELMRSRKLFLPPSINGFEKMVELFLHFIIRWDMFIYIARKLRALSP